MLYVPAADRAREAERQRKQRQDAENKVFAELQDKAQHLGYKLVKIKD